MISSTQYNIEIYTNIYEIYMPLHVSSTVVLIIGRSKLYYTASGIITHVGGRPVHRTANYRHDDTKYCIIQF